MKTHLKQDQFTVIERHGQLVIALNEEYLLPENAPDRLTSAQLEELDYGKLYRAYSPRGRKSKVDPRVMFKVKKTFWEKRAESQKNITSERGIYLRMCRSIQVEGAFALLKTDFGFRRFLTRGKQNVRTELFFLAMAFNLKKLWMKRENGRLKTHLSEIRIA